VSPYRDLPTSAEEEPQPPGEEWVLAVVLVVLGAVRVVIALATHEELAADVTIAALLGAIGCVLLAQLARRTRSV
jgi:hypothetical protein